ncbi:MAG: hypothetical protein E4G99_07160 [Anaerolineales bacterium]|nr:MAG: hypothetical protein E4G99_07160 [Anaerolineales bacterium]
MKKNLFRGAKWLLLALCGLAVLLPSAAAGATVALIVDGKFYLDLQPEIERLAADIARDLSVTTVVEVVDGATVTALSIRARIKELYTTQGLLGVLLIGDIPTAYLGDYPTPGSGAFATDAYYEDLDDYCYLDPDGNGVFNSVVDADGDGDLDWFLKTWISEHNREVWSGRLLPPTGATYAERVSMLWSYLDRNHMYRTGLRTYSRGMVYAESVTHNGEMADGEDDQATIYSRALAVIDDSWLFDRSAGDVLDFVWSEDLTQHMNLWLAGVHLPYEYGIVNVHGSDTGQWFGGTNWLFSSSYQTTPANTLLIDLASCNNGDFTAADYLGGWVLFAGGALAVRANTTPTMYVGTLRPDPDLQLMNLGLTIGETRLTNVLSSDSNVLLGDPTLRLRAPDDGSCMSADQAVVVLPPAGALGLGAGQVGSGEVLLTNEGAAPVTVYTRITSMTSIDHRKPWGNDFQSRFNVERTDFPMTLQPGETRAASVIFTYDGQAGSGTYRASFLLYTDSPATPYMWVGAEMSLLDDTTPVADAGPDQEVEQTSVAGAQVTLDGSRSYDDDGDPITYRWMWSGGSATGIAPTIVLPPGQTEVTLVVNDGQVDSAPDTVVITIRDTTAPNITLSVSPTTLWPPNHKMVLVAPTVRVIDACDPSPMVGLTSITMNEGDQASTFDPNYDTAVGSGNTAGDIQIDENGNLYVRAERAGTGSGRIYTIIFTATDASGNSATASATVTVPHNQ